MKHVVTMTQLEPMGTELKPPLKLKPTEPDWELAQAKELTMQGPGGKLVVIALCYWRQDVAPTEEQPEASRILLQ